MSWYRLKLMKMQLKAQKFWPPPLKYHLFQKHPVGWIGSFGGLPLAHVSYAWNPSCTWIMILLVLIMEDVVIKKAA